MPPTFVSIPDAEAEAVDVAGHRGQRLVLYRMRQSRAGGPVLLFGHACGFAAGAYLPLLERLCEFAEVYAFDARGHGGAESHPEDLSLYGSDDYALDLVRLGEALAPRPVHFIGHSLSAAAMLRLGCCHPAAFARVGWRALLLFEPPVFPSADRPEIAEVVEKDRIVRARTRFRRRDWPSPEALAAALSGRGLFRAVAPEFMSAYARAALRPVEGGFTLACAPEIEEATFAHFSEDTTFRALGGLRYDGPLHLVAGDPDTGPDRLWPTLLAPVIAERLGCDRMPLRRFVQLPACSHLMIQESPGKAFEIIHNSVLTD